MARPRTPSKILELKGAFIANPNRRRPAEPQFNSSIPDPPDHLTEAARVEWARVVSILGPVGVLTAADMAILALYCQAYGRWQEAEAHLSVEGLVVVNDGRQTKSPWLRIADDAMKAAHRFAVELGMTPSSRSRVSVANPPKPPSKWDRPPG